MLEIAAPVRASPTGSSCKSAFGVEQIQGGCRCDDKMGDNNDSYREDLDAISNDNLAKRLRQEFNFDCGPVTDSTRSVYLKKLKKLIEEKDGQNGLNESAGQSPVATGRKSTGRRSPSRQSPSRQSPSRQPKTQTPRSASATRKSRQELAAKVVNDHSDQQKPVDDEPEAFKTPRPRRQSALPRSPAAKSSPAKTPTRKSIATSHAPKTSTNQLTNYSSESSENDTDRDELTKDVRRSSRRKQTPPRPSTSFVADAGSKVPSARPYQNANSRQSLASASLLSRPPIRRVTTHFQTPQQSKLANFSDSETETGEQNVDEDEETKNISRQLLRYRVGLINNSSVTTQATPSSTYNGEENYSASSSNWVSLAILTFVVLFFVFIFSFYFYNRINSFSKLDDLPDLPEWLKEPNAPICDGRSGRSNQCFEKSDILPAAVVVKEIKSVIDNLLYKHYCGDAKHRLQETRDFNGVLIKSAVAAKYKAIREGRKEVESLPDTDIKDRDFEGALKLIELNPTWHIEVERDENFGDLTKFHLADDYPYNLPLMCRIITTFKRLMWQISIASLVVLISWCGFYYFRYKKRLVSQEQELIYDLVEKSLELLQSPDNPQSMPVLHIRDTLLSTAERKTSKYKKIWEKVVKFIESNESRVKVEIENIDGEDFKAWKWVAANPMIAEDSLISSPNVIKTGSIEWQGQAFGENSPAANNGKVQISNFVAPTCFLKIRNMYNRETQLNSPSNWKVKIKNAVLQKIISYHGNENHGIVHLDFDNSNDGIVYLRCNSITSATNAYHALHGWWCQGELVSVKFLKPERYYNRFSEAQNCFSPLAIEVAV